MRVSIALCTFNGAKFLPPQLESFLHQRRLPDELVVCDDGSTDGTVEQLLAFRERAPFAVRLILEPLQEGVSANFSRALLACTGDLCFPSDQDDVWLPEKLGALAATFDDPAVQLACCDSTLTDAALRPTGGTLWAAAGLTEAKRAVFDIGDPLNILASGNFIAGMSMGIRKSLASSVLPIPRVWMYDGWLAIFAALAGKIRLVDKQLVLYRQHGNNQVGAEHRGLIQDLLHGMKLPRNVYGKVAEQMTAVAERLEATGRSAVATDFRDRAEHFAARAGLPQKRLERISPVLRELTSRRYFRFSKGLVSAARDLVA